MRKTVLALAMLVFSAGFVVSHGGVQENEDEVGLYDTHMTAHHGSLSQWIINHMGADGRLQTENSATSNNGCPMWR